MIVKQEIIYNCYLLFLLPLSCYCNSSVNFQLSGPGLKPDKIVMPARYFFISPLGEIEDSVLAQLSKTDFDVEIKGITPFHRNCRCWVNILDRKDGSFIARYKLYDTCRDMEIAVKFKGHHIGDSPYTFIGPVYPEDCYCPLNSVKTWLEFNECGDVPLTIKADFEYFKNTDFNKLLKTVESTFNNSHSSSVCHYSIKNNNVYRTCYGKHVGFKVFMDNILLSLTRKVHIPDLEFFSNLGDWPLVRRGSRKVFPLFSWCGSKETLDIVMPTYEITQASLECMGRVSLDMLSVQGNMEKTWKEKIPKVFWRGRDSSRERLKLIDLAKKNPDLFNVSLTNFFFFKNEEDLYGPKTPHVSFFKFFDYKYQVNLDGTVAAYRFPFLLAGDSVVFKQDSIYYEHFYRDLTPWVHYIPFKTDLSDLVELIKWAIKNDGKVQEISRSGRTYARENLLPQQIFCYHVHLLNEWSKTLISRVEVKNSMEHVPQAENDGCDCVLKEEQLETSFLPEKDEF